MWQYMLDVLCEVQPTLKEALADRGLSEADIFIKAGEVGGGNDQGEPDCEFGA